MTDNRTIELLRKLLDERGVEHEDYAYVIQDTQERCEITRVRDYAGRVKARFMSCNEPGKVDVAVKLTPEQAITATLGRPKARSHPYGYERDTGCYDCTRCECGCINDISARYCNDCGGEIEIDESAEKEYYDGYSKHTVFAKKHDDGSLEFCERRYVPEDAATLGNDQELINLAHNAWSMALCAMQGMPIPADWGDAVERGLREHGIDVDGELAGFEVNDE